MVIHLKKYLNTLIIATLLLPVISTISIAGPKAGDTAPNFEGKDSNGTIHKLSNFQGKTVVLEWTNHECPFVVKHYNSGNMQRLQKRATDNGVIWLSIVSSAIGKQGYTTEDEANKIIKDSGSNATARILDSSGGIGRLYDAKTTPHMFVIDSDGKVAYAGAIDSDSSANPDVNKSTVNYVQEALRSLSSGVPVKVAQTTPYGCSVKY